MKAVWIAALLAEFGACGGTGSGLPGDERLVALDAAGAMQECQYLHDTYPVRHIACDLNNQFMIFNDDVVTCVGNHDTLAANNPDCAVTVAVFEACEAALYAEPDAYYCNPASPPPMSCLPLHAANCSK